MVIHVHNTNPKHNRTNRDTAVDEVEEIEIVEPAARSNIKAQEVVDLADDSDDEVQHVEVHDPISKRRRML
jgi:hypothetical protein